MYILLFLTIIALALSAPIARHDDTPDTPDKPEKPKIKKSVNLFTLPEGGGDSWSVDVDGHCHNLQSPVAGNVMSIVIPPSYECSLYKQKNCGSSKHAVAAPGSGQLSFTKVLSLSCSPVPHGH